MVINTENRLAGYQPTRELQPKREQPADQLRKALVNICSIILQLSQIRWLVNHASPSPSSLNSGTQDNLSTACITPYAWRPGPSRTFPVHTFQRSTDMRIGD